LVYLGWTIANITIVRLSLLANFNLLRMVELLNKGLKLLNNNIDQFIRHHNHFDDSFTFGKFSNIFIH
jgi:hypothetical protein